MCGTHPVLFAVRKILALWGRNPSQLYFPSGDAAVRVCRIVQRKSVKMNVVIILMASTAYRMYFERLY